MDLVMMGLINWFNGLKRNEKMYVCKGCGAMCRKDVETLPEWEANFGPDELKQLSEKEYCIWDEWCRECVDKKGFILFDSKHPVIKYLNQRKQYKTLVAEEFKAVKKMFIENLTDEILWQLNTKAFDWFVRETKCGKKKAAKAFCRDAEKQIKKHIENEI